MKFSEIIIEKSMHIINFDKNMEVNYRSTSVCTRNCCSGKIFLLPIVPEFFKKFEKAQVLIY